MLGISIALGAISAYLFFHLSLKRRKYPPGPIPLPILGNTYQFEEKYWKTLQKWAKQYGPIFTLWYGETPVVVLAKYNVIKECLMGKGLADIFSGRPRRYVDDFFFDKATAAGIAFSEGEIWKDQRRFALHVLRNLGFGKNVMEMRVLEQVEELVRNLKEEIFLSSIVDIKPIIELCVGNIINTLVLGFAFERGDGKFEELKDLLGENFEQRKHIQFMLLDDFPWLRFVPLLGHFGYDALSRQKIAFEQFFVSQLKEHKEKRKEGSEAEDFTSAYLEEIERRGKSDKTYNEQQLVTILGDLWTAGLETTVTTLTWAILFLIHHPEVQGKAREELRSALPDLGTPLSMSHRTATPYFAATIQEVQRRANIIPYNLEHTIYGGSVEIGGHRLEEGTYIQPLISAVLDDPEIFPQPEEFKPERFLEADGKTLKKVEEFVPFSLGKRSCMGESLAKTELYLILGTLLRRFKFSPVPDQPLPTLEPVVGNTATVQPFKVHVMKISS